MYFKLRNARKIVALLSVAVVVGLTTPSHAAKERVRAENRNGSPQGNNANGWRGELRGTDHQFHAWSGNRWTPAPANQRLLNGTLGALLFTNAAMAPDPLPNNPPPTGLFRQNFRANQTVNTDQWMLFDRIVDKGATTCTAAGPGCLGPTEFLINGNSAPSTIADPLRRFLRQPAMARSLWEVTITNDGQTSVTLDDLWINVDNTGNPFDMSIPFTPDGPLASPTPSFIAGEILAPGDSRTYSFLAGNDMLAISVETGTTIAGLYVRGMTIVPEPMTSALLSMGILALLRRRRGR